MTERPSLLLIDDDEAITAGLGSFLERSGFTVRVAGDGRDGLAALAEERFDVAVCDVIMPHMDGREFVRAAQAVAIQREAREQAAQAGFRALVA